MILETSEWITGIVEEHFEELQALWRCRLNSIDSPRWFEADLRKLDARIASHADALTLSAEHTFAMFEENLQGEREQVFSACFPLAYVNTPSARKLIFSKLESSSALALDGFADALCHAEPFLRWTDDHKLIQSAPISIAGVLTQALAFQGLLQSEEDVVKQLLHSDNRDERLRGWNILSFLPHSQLRPENVKIAWADKDPRVGIAATQAAIWTKQPWFAAYCRDECCSQSTDKRWAAKALGILGESSDKELIKSLIEDESLGLKRLELASSFGHPSNIPLLCEYMRSQDKKIVVKATSEFMRMTGFDVESETLTKVNHSELELTNEFDEAFEEEAFMPDVDRANRIWQDRQSEWSNYVYLHRGVGVERERVDVGNGNIDLLAQLESAMRAKYFGFSKTTHASRIASRSRWILSTTDA